MARPTLLSLVLVSVVLGSMHAAAQRGREQQKLTQRFDANKSGVLERKERDAARAWLKENPNPSGRRRRGPRGGRSGSTEPRGPGPRVSPNEVKNFTGKGLYNPSILRTLFLTFDSDDWEEELAAFRSTDVEVPATLLVDGKSYKKIGVRFRGNTSYRNVAAGQKRSFNLSIDLVNNKQRLGGYKTLNLLNCHSDPSFLREALHALIGRKFAPMPRTNLVHVVINGRSWGIYANVQQGNKDYQRDAFGTGKGARWRVPPDFSGRSGLSYLGENPLEYERRYKAKSGVDDEALLRLADLCYTLTQTSMEERREQLPAMLDIDGALWFLAIDNALLDGDGYLARASDYVLYMDPTGVFHLITYDNNELLRGGARGGPGRGGPGRGGPPPGSGDPGGRRRPPPGGNQRGGRRGGPGGRLSPEQSPLAGADRDDRPLLQKLLEVPEWRARYLAHLHSMTTQALNWQKLGPALERLHEMIADVTRADTRKLYGQEAFATSVAEIRKTVEKRVASIMKHPEIAGVWPSISSVRVTAVPGDQTKKLRVTAQPSDGVAIASAWLHWQLKRPGPFVAVLMQRQGKVFMADIPAQKVGERIRYYVEVRAAGDNGRLAFWPAGASSRPKRYRFRK
ncbi:MAG: CotH kinase family protein [Planctomycetota bacterium]|nr:CotH kinase family protein [Planctomycetota bacterium]